MDRTKTAKVSLFAVWTILLVLNVNGQSGCDTHSFANNIAFTSCSPLPALGSFLHWNFNEQNSTVSIAFRHPGTSSSSWIAWGLNPSGPQMSGTQALVAFTNSSGQFQAYTSSVDGYGTQLTRGDLSFGVSLVSATLVNGEATIFATLELPANLVMTNQVWQEGPVANGIPQVHQRTGDNMRSIGRIDFRTGQSSASGGGSGSRLRRRNCHDSYSACELGSDGIDRLVRLVQKMQKLKHSRPENGALYGAKITGGGSGGTVCVIGRGSLRSSEQILEIQRKYKQTTGFMPYVFEGSSPGAGKFGYLKIRKNSAPPSST